MAEAVPRFCVLGSGLAGRVAAFFLQRSLPHARITVVEHLAGRPSGQIRSVQQSGRVLEAGFQSSILVNKNGREALGLIRLLNLGDEVVSADIEASARRHLYRQGRVQLFPRLRDMLRHSPALLAEPLWPRGAAEDESVHAFVARRTSRAAADQIADPLCRGLLAGDARELSVRTCFPRAWFNERRFRSVFLGSMLSTFSAHQRRSWLSLDYFDPLLQRVSAGGRCYTLRQGLASMSKHLEDRMLAPMGGTRPVEFLRGASAVSLRAAHASGGAEVQLEDGSTLAADVVVAAIGPADLASLLEAGVGAQDVDVAGPAELCALLRRVPYASAATVNVTFDADVFRGRCKGAGYFVGSREDQPILGMAWDSQLFPDKSGRAALTAYVAGAHAGAAEGAEEAAMRAVREHLGILEEPAEVRATLWRDALPQYTVGHTQRLRQANDLRQRHLPWLQFAGAGFFGTRGAADEIVDGRELADALGRRFARFPGLVENEDAEDSEGRYGAGFDAD